MSSRYNQLFLNCPVCKHGINVADNEWLAICCSNCKIDIPREYWIDRDVLESQWIDSLEAAIRRKNERLRKKAYELCLVIEQLPAGEYQTKLAIMASDLLQNIRAAQHSVHRTGEQSTAAFDNSDLHSDDREDSNPLFFTRR